MTQMTASWAVSEIDHILTHVTDIVWASCSTRLALHVPSSYELERVVIIIIVIIIIIIIIITLIIHAAFGC